MDEIIKQELKNLNDKDKEKYYKFIIKRIEDNNDWKWAEEWFNVHLYDEKKEDPREVFRKDYEVGGGEEIYGFFKDHHTIDELLAYGFQNFPQEFIFFQKDYENSLYNQTIKNHGFKDLGYKDIVPSLTKKEKKEIIREIYRQEYYLSEKGYKNLGILEVNQEKGSKYIIQHQSESDGFIKEQTFENDDELIIYALEDGRMTHEIIGGVGDLLNPHRQVNQWFLIKQDFEEKQKEIPVSENKTTKLNKLKM